MLNHTGSVVLETDRLILRKFQLTDAENMFINWAASPEVTRYVTWFPHSSVEVSRNVIEAWIDEYQEPDYYQWAIVVKDINQPIGSIGVVRMNSDAASAEMGYCIGDKFWHQGYTSEALFCIMKHLFEVVGFNRISAIHDIRNPHSGEVMKKCGMKYEGTVREERLTKEGQLLTYSIYAALRTEWKKEMKLSNE